MIFKGWFTTSLFEHFFLSKIHKIFSLIDVKVVADGGDRFFAVNNFYFKNPYLQKLEILSQWKSGNLIFFDGKKSTIIDRFEGYFIF